MATRKIVPRADNEGGIGTALKRWASGWIKLLSLDNLIFPATQVPSADPNTLDDYEEGTWTMGVSFGGGTTGITYFLNTGYYTKIGNLIMVSGYCALSNKGSSIGAAGITGLPFTVGAYAAPTLYLSSISYANWPTGYAAPGGTTITLVEFTEAGVEAALTNADFVNTSNFIVNMAYRAG